MFLLQVELELKQESRRALEEVYLETFRPAVSRQEGFRAVMLLRPTDDGANYILSLAFDSRASQQKWVATNLHQQVWPRMEAHCAGYTVHGYEPVEPTG